MQYYKPKLMTIPSGKSLHKTLHFGMLIKSDGELCIEKMMPKVADKKVGKKKDSQKQKETKFFLEMTTNTGKHTTSLSAMIRYKWQLTWNYI